MKLSYLALCLPLCVVGVAGLTCVPGGQGCTREAKENMTCELGYVTGPCLSCECAKGEGESCDGPFGFLGKCAEHLRCAPTSGLTHNLPGGICVKIGEPVTEEPPYPEEPPQDPDLPEILTQKPRPYPVVHVPYA